MLEFQEDADSAVPRNTEADVRTLADCRSCKHADLACIYVAYHSTLNFSMMIWKRFYFIDRISVRIHLKSCWSASHNSGSEVDKVSKGLQSSDLAGAGHGHFALICSP